jgi:hypothetical protein
VREKRAELPDTQRRLEHVELALSAAPYDPRRVVCRDAGRCKRNDDGRQAHREEGRVGGRIIPHELFRLFMIRVVLIVAYRVVVVFRPLIFGASVEIDVLGPPAFLFVVKIPGRVSFYRHFEHHRVRDRAHVFARNARLVVAQPDRIRLFQIFEHRKSEL